MSSQRGSEGRHTLSSIIDDLHRQWEEKMMGEMLWHIRLAMICGILEAAARAKGVVILTCRRFPLLIPVSEDLWPLLVGDG
jgi:hypothetical protein